MRKILLLNLICFLALQGHQLMADRPLHPPVDDATFANVDEVVATDYSMIIMVDFNNQVMHNIVVITMKSLVDNLQTVILDQAFLQVESVLEGGQAVQYTVQTVDPKVSDPTLGAPLVITLKKPYNRNDVFKLQIEYLTTQKGSALSWMTPEQTAGKKQPYLYSQNEPCYARSWIPCQDTPSVKATYKASIIAPPQLTVRMSAKFIKETVSTDKKTKTTEVSQQIAVPTYLIAIVVGDLAYKKLGARTGVYTEPSMLEKSAKELEDLEEYLTALETYLTPYVWEEYNILILPPSFPFGGMENPLLTFASPTIIVGDKSQMHVAIHEIAHSWSGNLVTCIDWENLWLNEGFTVWEERKIGEQLWGRNFALTDAYIGNLSLYQDMKEMGFDSNWTMLNPQQFYGANPDDTETKVSYEKGFQFLAYLESVVGAEAFDSFLRAYFKKFAYQSINDATMYTFFTEFISEYYENSDEIKEKLDNINVMKWLNGKGMPPFPLSFQNNDILAANNLCDAYIWLKGESSPILFQKFYGFNVLQRTIFAQCLINKVSEVTIPIMAKIQGDLGMNSFENFEIKQRWIQLGIMVKDKQYVDAASSIVSQTGRLLYLQPIYRALMGSGFTKEAGDYYDANESFYSPITRSAIKGIIKREVAEDEPKMRQLRRIKL